MELSDEMIVDARKDVRADDVDDPASTASKCQNVVAGAPQEREAVHEEVYPNWR